MSKKEFARTICFVIILISIMYYLGCVFSFPSGEMGDGVKERVNSFYSQPKKTMDGIYVGASGVDRYWVAPQAYADYGETIFSFSFSTQPLVLCKYTIIEALKHQDPKYIIVDVRAVIKNSNQMQERFIRRVTDNMEFSKNRLDAINAALAYSRKGKNTVEENDWSFYFNFLKYHSKWNGGISLKDFLNPKPSLDYMGFAAHTDVIYKSRPQKTTQITKDCENLAEETEDVLIDLLNYCDTLKGKNILFVASPYPQEKDAQEKVNYAMKLIETRGYKTLNFNTLEMYNAVGLDFGTDFYDSHHVNLAGALKFTDYLANYLHTEYNLPDRRNNKKYDNWEKSFHAYKEATKNGAKSLEKKIKENSKSH